jgi:hypothetical protein
MDSPCSPHQCRYQALTCQSHQQTHKRPSATTCTCTNNSLPSSCLFASLSLPAANIPPPSVPLVPACQVCACLTSLSSSSSHPTSSTKRQVQESSIATLLCLQPIATMKTQTDYSLYLVTDSTEAILGSKNLVDVVEQALRGGGCTCLILEENPRDRRLHYAPSLHSTT